MAPVSDIQKCFVTLNLFFPVNRMEEMLRETSACTVIYIYSVDMLWNINEAMYLEL